MTRSSTYAILKEARAAALWHENEMASDEHVATALRAFAKALLQGLRNSTANGGPLSEQGRERGEQLKGLSDRVRAMANNPQAATYLGFEGIWNEAQQLGVEVPREITMAVASAFIQRPHVSSRVE
jgi:hypothetical protein